MFADLDETIKQILVSEMPIRNGEIDITFDQPKREWSARLTKPTVNFFLYDLRQNVQLRQFQWERVEASNGGRNVAARKRPPVRMDCHYMLTTWASEPEDEHRLMARTLLTLFRFPEIPPERLLGKLENQEFDVTTQLASHDKLTNAAEIWSALDNELRPSVSYLITIMLDPWTPVIGPVVRGLSMRANRVESDDPKEPVGQDDITQRGYDTMVVAGTVRTDEDEPVSGVSIWLEGTGLSAVSGENGRYKIRGVSPGPYTFIVSPPDAAPTTDRRHVPAPDGNYDFDL